MLRVDCSENQGTTTIRLQGRLVAEFAKLVRDLVMRSAIHRRLIIDLSEVLFVDEVGEDVLTWLKRIGSAFWADNSYSLDICERLELPLANQIRRRP